MRKLYDFVGWFNLPADADDRVRFTLLKGEHYKCSQSSMVQQLRIAATHCGVRIRVADGNNELNVTVLPKSEESSHAEADRHVGTV